MAGLSSGGMFRILAEDSLSFCAPTLACAEAEEHERRCGASVSASGAAREGAKVPLQVWGETADTRWRDLLQVGEAFAARGGGYVGRGPQRRRPLLALFPRHALRPHALGAHRGLSLAARWSRNVKSGELVSLCAGHIFALPVLERGRW